MIKTRPMTLFLQAVKVCDFDFLVGIPDKGDLNESD